MSAKKLDGIIKQSIQTRNVNGLLWPLGTSGKKRQPAFDLKPKAFRGRPIPRTLTIDMRSWSTSKWTRYSTIIQKCTACMIKMPCLPHGIVISQWVSMACDKGCVAGKNSGGYNSLFQQMCIRLLLCCRHCGWCWGISDQQGRSYHQGT
jgi:hypothetical protein